MGRIDDICSNRVVDGHKTDALCRLCKEELLNWVCEALANLKLGDKT